MFVDQGQGFLTFLVFLCFLRGGKVGLFLEIGKDQEKEPQSKQNNKDGFSHPGSQELESSQVPKVL